MLFAAVATVFVVGRVFVLIERRRANEKVVDESSVQTEGGIATVVTMALAAIAVYCGLSLLGPIGMTENPRLEFF